MMARPDPQRMSRFVRLSLRSRELARPAPEAETDPTMEKPCLPSTLPPEWKPKPKSISQKKHLKV